ncbi:MAG: hypothetical protein Q9169_004775, partial [Polycauliona sp. 2 TL-2023]
ADNIPPPRTLSPEATRLLLARRLGLSRYHGLEGVDEPTLKILNEVGGQQKLLLSSNEQRQEPQRNLIVIEDVGDPGKFLDPKHHETAFTMSNTPDSSQTLTLVDDLFEQAKEIADETPGFCSSKFGAKSAIQGGFISAADGTTGACYLGLISPRVKDLALFVSDLNTARPGRSAIFRLSLSHFAKDKDLPQAEKDLSQAISHVLRPTGRTSNSEFTVIIMPPSNAKAKRTYASQYGSYAMPRRQPLQPREGQTEAPLAAPPAPQTSLASQHVSKPQTLKASSVPKPGILPFCQSSLDKLIEVTNNCSGHGTPYLKNKDLTGKESKDENLLKARAESQCYACKCSKTVLSRGEGKGVKTIYWAGPACSKKDVSTSFWLLAGISIALVVIVSWGVGLMFSIGQEDLPSVIGAGVTGPRAQK